MDIDFLKDFTVLAEQENLTEAADILNISPSALSNNLHKLEKELGYPLFARTSKGIRLNDSGRYFLSWVQKNRDFKDKIIDKLHRSASVRGVLKIGAAMETDTLFILLAAFQTRYPEIQVEVYSGGFFMDQPLMTDFDAFVMPRQSCELPCIVLGRRSELFVLMREDHPLAGREELTMEDLQNQPFVICASGGKVDWIYDYCRQHGFHPSVQILCEDLNRNIDVMVNSQILALGYNTMRQLRESINGLMAIPLQTENQINQSIILAWRESPLNPLADLLSEFAIEFTEKGREAFM